MHDPSTVAFEIKYPFPEEVNKKTGYVYRRPIITIWHEDPCTDGTDDSCGRFLRSRHLNQEVLKRYAYVLFPLKCCECKRVFTRNKRQPGTSRRQISKNIVSDTRSKQLYFLAALDR